MTAIPDSEPRTLSEEQAEDFLRICNFLRTVANTTGLAEMYRVLQQLDEIRRYLVNEE